MGIRPQEILDGLARGVAWARDSLDMDIGLLVALDYANSSQDVDDLIALAISGREQGVVGIDLQGIPKGSMARFQQAYDKARAAGLGCRAHAGEVQDAASVRAALDLLQVKRVAHGVQAIQAPDLMQRLTREKIALDIRPSSNVALGVTPCLAAHPVRRFFDMGVPITLNSDDPILFQTSLSREYQLMASLHGFTRSELLSITRTAVEHAFADEAVKQRLRHKMSRVLDETV